MTERMSTRSRAYVETRNTPAERRFAAALAASREADAVGGALYTFADPDRLLGRRSAADDRPLSCQLFCQSFGQRF